MTTTSQSVDADQDFKRQQAVEALRKLRSELIARRDKIIESERNLFGRTDGPGGSRPTRDNIKESVVHEEAIPGQARKRVVLDMRKLPRENALWLLTRVRSAQKKRINAALEAVNARLNKLN